MIQLHPEWLVNSNGMHKKLGNRIVFYSNFHTRDIN